jgi:hypothetical protein
MNRALFKMILGLAVALGLTLGAAPIASASPAAPAAPAAAAQAPDCSAQVAANNRANASYASANASVKAAQAKVTKLKKKIKKAKKHHAKKQVRKLNKKLKKAKQSLREKKQYRDRVAVTRSYTQRSLARCQAGTPAQGADSPIQALCDAGIPQALCDALAGLIPGGSTANPVGLLCAQFPQAAVLCDAISAGLPTDPADLLDLVETLAKTLGLDGVLNTVLGSLGIGTLGDLLSGAGAGSLISTLTDLLNQLGLGGLLPRTV